MHNHVKIYKNVVSKLNIKLVCLDTNYDNVKPQSESTFCQFQNVVYMKTLNMLPSYN